MLQTKQGTSNPSRASSGFMLNTPITWAGGQSLTRRYIVLKIRKKDSQYTASEEKQP